MDLDIEEEPYRDMIGYNSEEEIDYNEEEEALELQAESNRDMSDYNSGEEIDYNEEEEALELQAELNTDMSDYNSGEEIDYNDEEEGLDVEEEPDRDMTDDNLGEETDDNSIEEQFRSPQGLQRNPSKQHLVTNVKEMIEDTKEVREKLTSLSVRRESEEVTSADKVSIHTGENIATAGDTHEKLPSAIVQTEDSDFSEEPRQPFRSPQRPQWNPSKQHLVKNVKEMIEDTKEVREKLTSLSVRRESEEGSVTPADKVSIHRGENIATAGDTHEDLPSAIVQTEDSVVSEESLQDLSENIGKCWKVVGRKLKLTEGQLENLEDTNHPTLQEKIYQMLLVWKRKRGSAGTYVVLGDALKKAGRVDLQEDLLKTYEPT